MMVSWFGGRWGVIDGKARDTFLPIFWVEATTEAGAPQMRAFAPLLRARAAEAALRRWGRPAGLGLAMAAVAPLVAAAVLWTGGGGGDEAAAASALGGGYERLEAGEQQHPPALGQRQQGAAAQAAAGEDGLPGSRTRRRSRWQWNRMGSRMADPAADDPAIPADEEGPAICAAMHAQCPSLPC